MYAYEHMTVMLLKFLPQLVQNSNLQDKSKLPKALIMYIPHKQHLTQVSEQVYSQDHTSVSARWEAGASCWLQETHSSAAPWAETEARKRMHHFTVLKRWNNHKANKLNACLCEQTDSHVCACACMQMDAGMDTYTHDTDHTYTPFFTHSWLHCTSF